MTDFLVGLFVKDNKNVTDQEVRERYGKFASVTGIATNVFLSVIKFVIGTLSNSISITADAVNNLSDSGSSVILLLGFKLSGKPADEEHPYGHARMEYIAGLIVSFFILMLGLKLIQSSVDKIINPAASSYGIPAVAVLGVAILMKLWQCLFYRKIGRRINSIALLTTAADSRNDILATSAVLIAAVISQVTGYNLDGYMGVVVAGFILISGVKLIMDTISPLLGTAPQKDLVNCITQKVLGHASILGIHDLHVHSYGPAKVFASLHCEMPAEQDIMLSHDIVDNIERDMLKEHGVHLVIHLDPVVTSDEKTDALKEEVKRILRSFSGCITMHDFRAVWDAERVNVCFDITVPYRFALRDGELIARIADQIKQYNNTCDAVITVDHADAGQDVS